MSETLSQQPSSDEQGLVGSHLRLGWCLLLVCLMLGIALELFHGFKLGLYLDLDNQTRRFLWTLAHAHGTLLALVLIAFAGTVRLLPGWAPGPRRLASRCLKLAALGMPAGFFLGGFLARGGDPGPGVVLVVPAGLLLLAGVYLTAAAAGTR